jgi:hypothetical protein
LVPDYDKGKAALEQQVDALSRKMQVLILENDTLKDVLERKKHLLDGSRRNRSKIKMFYAIF